MVVIDSTAFLLADHLATEWRRGSVRGLKVWEPDAFFFIIRKYDQMVNTKIRLIIFFAAKGGEALYSQQKQDRELTVAQIMNSLLPNSDLN